MKHLQIALVIVALSTLSIHAAEPATQPAADETKIQALIQQLGDDDYTKREAATEEIKKIGKPALPALEAAKKDKDPEIASRADAIVGSLNKKPDAPHVDAVIPEDQFAAGAAIGGMAVGGGGMVQIQIHQVNSNGDRDIQSNVNGRKVHLVENADGIKLTITEPKDGKEETKEYTAKSADELKKEHPEVYGEYEKLNKGNIIIQQGDIQLQPMPMPPQVAKHFKQMQQGRLTIVGEPGEDPTEIGATVSSGSDELKAQLGDGVVIRNVDADSRALKMGLQPMDLVQKVNGKAVTTPEEFAEAVKVEGKLTVDLLRKGKPVQLQEK